MIHLAKDDDNLADYLNYFEYQRELTTHLDELPNEPLSQSIVNEIVLWKVNRYVCLSDEVRREMHSLRGLSAKQHEKGRTIIEKLLSCDGVDLPMASTLLRFQNANVFQIIDRHAYRALFGVAYPLYPASRSEQKISTYFRYLDALHSLASSSHTQFRDLDRILYIFDKKKNGKLKDKRRNA